MGGGLSSANQAGSFSLFSLFELAIAIMDFMMSYTQALEYVMHQVGAGSFLSSTGSSDPNHPVCDVAFTIQTQYSNRHNGTALSTQNPPPPTSDFPMSCLPEWRR